MKETQKHWWRVRLGLQLPEVDWFLCMSELVLRHLALNEAGIMDIIYIYIYKYIIHIYLVLPRAIWNSC